METLFCIRGTKYQYYTNKSEMIIACLVNGKDVPFLEDWGNTISILKSAGKSRGRLGNGYLETLQKRF